MQHCPQARSADATHRIAAGRSGARGWIARRWVERDTHHNEDAALIVSDDRLKMLSFTGSSAVGWKLKASAGKKKVTLELGGNAQPSSITTPISTSLRTLCGRRLCLFPAKAALGTADPGALSPPSMHSYKNLSSA